MIHINCSKKFHYLEAPIIIFVCGCQYYWSWVSCWPDAPHFLLKTFTEDGFAMGLAFLSWAPEAALPCSVWHRIDSVTLDQIKWLRFTEYSDVNEPVPMTFLFFYDWTGFFFQYSHSQNVGQIWTEQWQAGVAKLSLWGTPYLLEIENKSEVVFFWEPVYK